MKEEQKQDKGGWKKKKGWVPGGCFMVWLFYTFVVVLVGQGSLIAREQRPLTRYKATLNAPIGDEPLCLDMSSIGKGQVQINWQSIKRYWTAYATGSWQGAKAKAKEEVVPKPTPVGPREKLRTTIVCFTSGTREPKLKQRKKLYLNQLQLGQERN
nr:beta-galactosidase 3 [Tanacetum cinerariifolium]